MLKQGVVAGSWPCELEGHDCREREQGMSVHFASVTSRIWSGCLSCVQAWSQMCRSIV